MAKQRNVLFLLRSYNDIDHIAPIIWKAVNANIPCLYFFTDQDLDKDHRIQFLAKHGASRLRVPALTCYHRARILIKPRRFRRILDYLTSFSIGVWYLVSKDISCIINEWSGPFGREMAEYFLRAGSLLGLKCICVPHGYHFWTNTIINTAVKEYVEKFGSLPSFADRARYTTYVVQSENIRNYYVAHGMPVDKLQVLGSARFCEEWRKTLSRFSPKLPMDQPDTEELSIVMFIPDWSYFIDRTATISLINALAKISQVHLLIKQNTRGTGTISHDELEPLNQGRGALIVGDECHSPSLISRADCLINFASSIGLEALGQGKLVLNPTYLTGNQTIFDESGAVIDASTEKHMIELVSDLQQNCLKEPPSRETIDNFLHKHVDAGLPSDSVLQGYVDLITV